jgi:anti-anti-sigma factor
MMTLNNDRITGVLKVSGTLDIEAANPLREAIIDSFRNQSDIAADLSEVDQCDAAALQVLLASRQYAVSTGKAFSIIMPSVAITAMAAALGLSIGATGEARGHTDAG